jgi:hypothetical protein
MRIFYALSPDLPSIAVASDAWPVLILNTDRERECRLSESFSG